jgi:dinuclear metal center YbgI/SA1388 family protein
MATRNEIVSYSNDLLKIQSFKDYAPNGLQIEGKDEIKHIVSGVTASLQFIDAAIQAQADAILVHHGYFWRNEAAEIIGMKYRRIKTLMQANISLLAYHLPLDAHPTLGNNAQLAHRLEINIEDVMNRQGIGNIGSFAQVHSVDSLRNKITEVLAHKPLVISGGNHAIKRIAWCTGAAQSYIEEAVALGADAFISGEISENTIHIAREAGIHYFAAGHHATERYGVMSLGEHLQQHFNIKHSFIDCGGISYQEMLE